MELLLEHPTTSIEQRCFHCGDPIVERIDYDNKKFCCHGCVTVYDLLANNGLDHYYDLNKSPGRKAAGNRFDYLENTEIVTSLLDFENETVAKVTLFIPSIHCSSCIWLLENLSRLLPGVTQSRVFFVKKELSVSYRKNELLLKELVIFLNKIGYAPEINLGTNKQAKKRVPGSTALKIAVAGFCFGNSMLLSLPEYLDTHIDMDEGFRSYFGYINLALAVPVLLFSARDYFRSAWGSLRQGFVNIDVPIALGIIALFVRSMVEVVLFSGAGYSDSLTGLVFFLLLGKWFQGKSYDALSFERDFKSFFPIAVKRITDTGTFVPLEQVKIGDELDIHNQEIVPVDGVLLNGSSEIDYSFVTGESVREPKIAGDLLYAGGRHFGGPIRIRVQKEVETSYLTSLWNQETMRTDAGADHAQIINRVATYFTWAILLIALVSSVAWYFTDPSKIINVVTSVLIVACPCALALAVPFAYGHTMRLFGRAHFYLKNSDVIERMARVRDLVFDKTGTLTTTKGQQVTFQGNPLGEKETAILYTALTNSMHPLSRQIVATMEDRDRLPIESYHELAGLGIEAIILGVQIRIGSARLMGVDEDPNHEGSHVYIEIDQVLAGRYIIKSSYRTGMGEWLNGLRKRFILHLLSGDRAYEQKKLEPYFDNLNFNQKPKDKLEYIERLEGNSLMVGDGLNDAGALKKASVGIAVADDLHQFSPSCDAILRGDRLGTLPELLQMSRLAVHVVYSAIVLSFLYNMVGLYFAVTGQLTPLTSAILMPLSSVSVVGFITLVVHFTGSKLLALEQ